MRFTLVAAAAALFALAGISVAAGMGPDAVMHQLYEQKISADMAEQYDTTDKLITENFAPDLKALYDEAIKSDEPVIDFDIFYNAQDFSVTDVEARTVSENGDTAVVRVSFKNFNEPDGVTFSMVRIGGEWKISDADYGEGFTLRGIMAAGPE